MRQLLLLLAISVLFGAGYFALKLHKESKQKEESQMKRIFPQGNLDAIRTIEIYRQSETPHRVVLRKEGNRWWIVEPIRYRAVDSTLDSLVSQVRDKTYERSFTPSKPLEVYGLNPPRYIVTFYTETTPYTLAVGNVLSGPSAGRVYIGRGTTHPSEILITFTGFQYHLSKNLDDYRSRDVVWEFPNHVTYMRLVSEVATMELTKTTEGWFLKEKPLDTAKVEGILSRLRTLTVRDFYGDWPTATPPGGETKPKRMITISGDTQVTYWFFSPNTREGYVPLRVSERPILMSISEYAYRDLWKSPKELEVEKPPPSPSTEPALDVTAPVTAPSGSQNLPTSASLPATPPMSLLPRPATDPPSGAHP